MVTLREFSAWITCDGTTLMEYETRNDHYNRSATCWVPSDAGKVFTVNWRDHGSQIPSAAYISLDGTQVPGRYLWGTGITFRNSVRSGPTSERPFLFSKFEDNGGKAIPPSREEEVGTVVLRIKQIQRGEPRPANKYQVLPGQLPTEFGFTTGGVCATFGREVQGYEQWPQTWTSPAWEPGNNHSYVKFIFRYRPMQFLIAQGIAPRVSPVRTKATTGDSFNPETLTKPLSGTSATSTPTKGKSKASDKDNETPTTIHAMNTSKETTSQVPIPMPNASTSANAMSALGFGRSMGPVSYYRDHPAPTRMQQQYTSRNVSGASVNSTGSGMSSTSMSSIATGGSANSGIAGLTTGSAFSPSREPTPTPIYPHNDDPLRMPQELTGLPTSMSLDESTQSLFQDFMDLDQFDSNFMPTGSSFGTS